MATADRHRGALVGLAVGDAAGAPFEGSAGPLARPAVEAALGDRPAWPTTDDTAMALGLAESLLACRDLDQDHLARTFARHHRLDPHRGYGAAVRHLLDQVADGGDWRLLAPAQFGGKGSFGNGAAMRVAPAALAAADVGEAVSWARRSAATTHAHPDAQAGAAVMAAAVAVLVDQPAGAAPDGGPLLDQLAAVAGDGAVRSTLARVGDAVAAGRLDAAFLARDVGTGVAAAEAVPAAVGCLLVHPGSFADCVLGAVCLGGDTDTVAAMAGALSGALLGEGAIPPDWRRRTEHAGRAGQLAEALADLRAERRRVRNGPSGPAPLAPPGR